MTSLAPADSSVWDEARRAEMYSDRNLREKSSQHTILSEATAVSISDEWVVTSHCTVGTHTCASYPNFYFQKTKSSAQDELSAYQIKSQGYMDQISPDAMVRSGDF